MIKYIMYIALWGFLVGCNTHSEIDASKFMLNKDLGIKELVFKSFTVNTFSEEVKYDNNCIIFERKYPRIKINNKNSIPISKYNYKICISKNILYHEDQNGKTIILSSDEWELDDNHKIKCSIKGQYNRTILDKERTIIKVECNNGEYSLFADSLGIVESGFDNKPEAKLIKIKPL